MGAFCRRLCAQPVDIWSDFSGEIHLSSSAFTLERAELLTFPMLSGQTPSSSVDIFCRSLCLDRLISSLESAFVFIALNNLEHCMEEHNSVYHNGSYIIHL